MVWMQSSRWPQLSASCSLAHSNRSLPLPPSTLQRSSMALQHARWTSVSGGSKGSLQVLLQCCTLPALYACNTTASCNKVDQSRPLRTRTLGRRSSAAGWPLQMTRFVPSAPAPPLPPPAARCRAPLALLHPPAGQRPAPKQRLDHSRVGNTERGGAKRVGRLARPLGPPPWAARCCSCCSKGNGWPRMRSASG